MKVLSITIVGIRFILELVTILGLLGGLFTQKTYPNQVLYQAELFPEKCTQKESNLQPSDS